MKVAKEFKWEMGHRLPEHFGNCKNIHGHSYKMIAEFEGRLNENDMIIDLGELYVTIARHMRACVRAELNYSPFEERH